MTAVRYIATHLLKGAEPVCCDCRRALEPGEARISNGRLWRCTDCEYAAQRSEAASPAGRAEAS